MQKFIKQLHFTDKKFGYVIINPYICIIKNEVITIKRYTIMATKNIIKEVSYKGHAITMFEDGFHQKFVIIDNDESKLYDSIADAKRVIRGEQPYYEIN